MPRPDASLRLKAAQPEQGPSKLLIGAVVATLVLLVGGFAWLRTDPFAAKDAAAPEGGAAAGGGVELYPGRAKAGVPTVDLFEDFQCPACHRLEVANGRQLQQMAAAGTAKVVLHVMSFLDGSLGNDSSARAANAAFCAADAGRFPEYHAAVFARQPKDEGQGYSDAVLGEAAQAAGITGQARSTWDACVKKGTYRTYVTDTEKAANEAGVNNTPTLKVNGTKLDQQQTARLMQEPGSVAEVVEAAAGS